MNNFFSALNEMVDEEKQQGMEEEVHINKGERELNKVKDGLKTLATHHIAQVDSDDDSDVDGNDLRELVGLGLLKLVKQKSSYIEDSREMAVCMVCNYKFNKFFDFKGLHYITPCLHLICKKCLNAYIEKHFLKQDGQLKCLVRNCNSQLNSHDYETVLGKKHYQRLDDKLFMQMLDLQQCVYCKEKFEFVPGKASDLIGKRDEQGHRLTIWAKEDYAQNRFKCPGCHKEQCKTCHHSPYHLGYTCEDYCAKEKSFRCRYCDNTITPHKKTDIPDICNDLECLEKKENACHTKLECGHYCGGFQGEKEHLVCLHEDCDKKEQMMLMGQSGSDYCGICYVEGLYQAPTIQMKCGHKFHYSCIEKRIFTRWYTPRIFFTFMLCPLCKAWCEFPKSTQKINTEMKVLHDIYDKVLQMSLLRLKHEDKDKDKRLSDFNDPYYQKPQEYAMAIYSYYQCWECKNPYFGGLKSCENIRDGAQQQKDFKREDLIGSCCVNVGLGEKECEKHGKDYIDYKCRYCCSVAQWFCFGTTHFCEPCHNKWQEMQKKTQAELGFCEGGQDCPLGAKNKHPLNGTEFSLGCGLCRNLKDGYVKEEF